MNFASAQRVNTVVLDAGHGGHDTGALGKNSREKDITLAIVLKLRDYIRDNMKDVKVILTRSDDTFVELYRRAHIANENKADLFISIHCNSTKSTNAYGVETFVMGLHKSEANLAVAKAENAAILLEDDYVEKYDGFDPNSPEGNIFFSMMQNAFLDKSLAFAGKVQHQLVDNLNMFNRGVKQAGFLVLYKTAMPGVLIETGFISNAEDERFLMSADGQTYIASAIFRAFKYYKEEMERKDNKAQQVHQEYYQEPVVVKPPDVYFRVQFTSSKKKLVFDAKKYKDMPDIREYKQDGWYKYSTGNFKTYDEAIRHQKFVRDTKKYKDAFIICFLKDERITLEKALELTKK
ncbi:MAG TPA: N-acetylmuramoyl-L-alanine amidase [Bacteroidales bacterium]|nr:N-acetylmuramoyl-L-alanine amidase [Bacteroidales bacterium]